MPKFLGKFLVIFTIVPNLGCKNMVISTVNWNVSYRITLPFGEGGPLAVGEVFIK